MKILLILLFLFTTPCYADEIIYGDLTITEDLKMGTTAPTIWNTGQCINGEVVCDDTIDDDSIDLSDITCVDLDMSDCGAITASGFTGPLTGDSTGMEGVDWGTMTDTKYCVYDLAGTEVDCNSTISATLEGLTDTTLTSETKNDHLIYNGSAWVNAPDGTTFTFSCTDFNDNENYSTALIGTGDWQAADAITFSATYANGPPTTADIQKTINGAAYATINAMDGAAYTSGNNTAAVAYPAAKDQYLRFRLESDDGVDSDTDYDDNAIYFRNYGWYGVYTDASGYTEAEIETNLTSQYETDSNCSETVNPAAGEYIVWAFPTTYTALDEGDDYAVDGGTDFRFNSIAAAFTQDNAALSITNTAGYAEDYDVYVSDVADMAGTSFQVSTSYSSNPQNYIYYGVTSTASGYNAANCTTLDDDDGYEEAETDAIQVWTAITLGASEYGLWCIPKRWGDAGTDYDFKDNDTGLGFDFQNDEEVEVTNVNGWKEIYRVYRTTNSNLGLITVETQ